MATDIQQNLTTKNEQYASSFTQGHLALPPAKKYLVAQQTSIILSEVTDIPPVTCMDARIDPAAAFGIDLGDAHVIRNAGGQSSPVQSDPCSHPLRSKYKQTLMPPPSHYH